MKCKRCKAELIVRSMKHKGFNKDGSAKKNDNKFVYSGKKTFGYFCPKCKRWDDKMKLKDKIIGWRNQFPR